MQYKTFGPKAIFRHEKLSIYKMMNIDVPKVYRVFMEHMSQKEHIHTKDNSLKI